MHCTQRNRWHELGLLAAALLVAPSACAIDCSKARTSTEKVICADPKLQALDYQLNRDYRKFVKYHKATKHYDCLVEDEAKRQKQWLQQRDACGGDARCIQKAYQDRQAALNQYTVMCVGGDNMPQYAGRSCYKPDTTPTAPVASTASPTAPMAFTGSAAEQKCSDTITAVPRAVLEDVFIHATEDQVNQWTADLNVALSDQNISGQLNSKVKLAVFLSQAAEETGRGKTLEEDLRYRAANLMAWKYFRTHGDEAFKYGMVTKKFIDYLNANPGEAKKYGFLDASKNPLTYELVHEADQEAIANRAYGSRRDLGNGDIASGDGWKYRGRGLIQITGRNIYTWVGKKVKTYFGQDVDIVKSPDRVSGDLAMKTAIGYWGGRVKYGLGAEVEDLHKQEKSKYEITKRITLLVNGGYNNLSTRYNELMRILKLRFFTLCKDIENGDKNIAVSFAIFFGLA